MKSAAPVLTSPLALSPARLTDYVALIRPRMALMILLTVLLGGLLASVGTAPADRILNAVLSTALVTAAASALNQYLERHSDGRMVRTANRPLPAGRLTPSEVLAFGIALAAIGFAYQAFTLPLATTAVTTFTFFTYVFIYTPAKQWTTLNTIIGAVPGALPPVIGWTAVRGEVDAGALVLFLVLFFWQVPHFLAIAWMYRDDYAAAGHQMLTVDDPVGTKTARQMLLYLLALIPVSLLAAPAAIGYVLGALALGGFYLRPVIGFCRNRTERNAREVLKASLVYLPGLLSLMVTAKFVANS